MDRKQVISSDHEEVNQLRRQLSQLGVNSVEQQASDEVRKWRQNFDTSSSHHMERILDEIEKRKQLEVTHLANELRASLEEFKETNVHRLNELDEFISKAKLDDDIQLDYIKFELDTIKKQIQSLHINILVTIVDTSAHRRSSNCFTRNTIELIKVFDFKKTETGSISPSSFFDPLKNLVRRASITGASYYDADS
jgi:hypothetical protein